MIETQDIFTLYKHMSFLKQLADEWEKRLDNAWKAGDNLLPFPLKSTYREDTLSEFIHEWKHIIWYIRQIINILEEKYYGKQRTKGEMR